MKPVRCTGRPVGMAVAIALAMLLKLYYSRAGSEDLAWIIGPTALLTEIFSGLSFSHEPGFGWVDAREKSTQTQSRRRALHSGHRSIP